MTVLPQAVPSGALISQLMANSTTEQNDNKTEKEVVVIVDPYSSGKYLVEEVKNSSVKMVAIQSSLDLADFWLEQLEREYFVETFVHSSMEDTLEKLSKYKVIAVTPGSEPGVYLSEDLATELNMEKANGAATKEWRRHKFDMQERCREIGIRAVRQIYSSEPEEVIEWQKTGNKGLWPIIVKPAMSGGTDGVFWCHTPEDIKAAFASECGKVNVNGELNDKLLAQEFLDGIEYIVDCVSNGEDKETGKNKHVLCGIWQYKKIYEGKNITYEYAKIIPSEGEIQDQLRTYMWQVLDALDIRYGSSHGEVIMTVDGPCLVEVGARMHGLKGPMMTQQATGTGIHELVADVLIGNGRLTDELWNSKYRYHLKKFCYEAMLNNRVFENHGVLSKPIDCDNKIKNLRSCIAVYPNLNVGEILPRTKDLATAPGCFMLVHPSKEVCESDLLKVREFEETDFKKGGLYYYCSEAEWEAMERSTEESNSLKLSRTVSHDRNVLKVSRANSFISNQAASPASSAGSRRPTQDSTRFSGKNRVSADNAVLIPRTISTTSNTCPLPSGRAKSTTPMTNTNNDNIANKKVSEVLPAGKISENSEVACKFPHRTMPTPNNSAAQNNAEREVVSEVANHLAAKQIQTPAIPESENDKVITPMTTEPETATIAISTEKDDKKMVEIEQERKPQEVASPCSDNIVNTTPNANTNPYVEHFRTHGATNNVPQPPPPPHMTNQFPMMHPMNMNTVNPAMNMNPMMMNPMMAPMPNHNPMMMNPMANPNPMMVNPIGFPPAMGMQPMNYMNGGYAPKTITRDMTAEQARQIEEEHDMLYKMTNPGMERVRVPGRKNSIGAWIPPRIVERQIGSKKGDEFLYGTKSNANKECPNSTNDLPGNCNNTNTNVSNSNSTPTVAKKRMMAFPGAAADPQESKRPMLAFPGAEVDANHPHGHCPIRNPPPPMTAIGYTNKNEAAIAEPKKKMMTFPGAAVDASANAMAAENSKFPPQLPEDARSSPGQMGVQMPGPMTMVSGAMPMPLNGYTNSNGAVNAKPEKKMMGFPGAAADANENAMAAEKSKFPPQVPMQFPGQAPMQFPGQIPMQFPGQIPMQISGPITPQKPGQMLMSANGRANENGTLNAEPKKKMMGFPGAAADAGENAIAAENSKFPPQVPMQMSGQIPMQMSGQIPMQMPGQIPMQMSGPVPMQMQGPMPMTANGYANKNGTVNAEPKKKMMGFPGAAADANANAVAAEATKYPPQMPMQMSGQIPMQMPGQIPMQFPGHQVPMQFPGQMPSQPNGMNPQMLTPLGHRRPNFNSAGFSTPGISNGSSSGQNNPNSMTPFSVSNNLSSNNTPGHGFDHSADGVNMNAINSVNGINGAGASTNTSHDSSNLSSNKGIL